MPTEPLTRCVRCMATCAVRPTPPPADLPVWGLKAATSPDVCGLCAECAAHWFLMTVDGLRWGHDEDRDSFLFVLGLPEVQQRFSATLGRIHPELGTLDWGRLLAQWDLPWPDEWPLPQSHNDAFRNARPAYGRRPTKEPTP